MYTVKELIEALQKCPEDYKVIFFDGYTVHPIEQVGIDNDEETVDLFSA